MLLDGVAGGDPGRVRRKWQSVAEAHTGAEAHIRDSGCPDMTTHPYENTHSSDLENVRLARTGIGTSDQIATQTSPLRPGGLPSEPDGILGNLLERLFTPDGAFGDLLQRLPGLDARLRGLTRVICVRATRTSGGSGVEAPAEFGWSLGRRPGRLLATLEFDRSAARPENRRPALPGRVDDQLRHRARGSLL
jgi:hypothetical protein